METQLAPLRNLNATAATEISVKFLLQWLQNKLPEFFVDLGRLWRSEGNDDQVHQRFSCQPGDINDPWVVEEFTKIRPYSRHCGCLWGAKLGEEHSCSFLHVQSSRSHCLETLTNIVGPESQALCSHSSFIEFLQKPSRGQVLGRSDLVILEQTCS